MVVFLSVWPGVKAELFFPSNRHFQHLLAGLKDGTAFRLALFPRRDLAPPILVAGQQGSQVNRGAPAGDLKSQIVISS